MSPFQGEGRRFKSGPPLQIMINKLYLYIKCLAAVGIILALFLLWEQIFHPSIQPCYINSSINCNAVINGPVAKTLSIPTPLYGLIGYIFILISSIKGYKNLLMFMASFGLVFCAYIAYIEIIQLHVLCPVCLGCDIDMVATFILSLIIYKKSSKH
jgi:uncharacterized membrane protein